MQLATALRTTGRTLADAWAAGDVAERNRLLRRAQARIRLRPAPKPSRVLDPARVLGLTSSATRLDQITRKRRTRDRGRQV